MSTQSNVRKEVSKSAITLDEIKVSENQKEGTLTAQIRQTITTVSMYPSKRVDSNLQDSLFAAADFGFVDKPYTNTENRVAWIPVPTDATKETVAPALAKASANGACIYRVMSNAPILEDRQQYAISQGLRTMDEFADTQAVRYPIGAKNDAGEDISNQLVLDGSGKVQYRRTFYSATPKEDVDNRGQIEEFRSAAIKAELMGASVLAGQTV